MSTMRITSSSQKDPVVVRVPGSKSVANRALMIAALTAGESVISNLPDGDDTEAMLAALTILGVSVDHVGDSSVRILGPIRPLTESVVNAQLAGTTSRFLLAMCCFSEHPITITGEAPLLARPVGELAQALRSIGFTVSPQSSSTLPLTVSCPSDMNEIASEVTLRGDISSQFISALMMIGPLLTKGLQIHIEGDLVSRSYVEMTAAVMSTFGASVAIEGNLIVISPKQYGSTDIVVEPDFSSAAFPIVAGLLSGRAVRVPDLALAHMQGDARILEIVQTMGAQLQVQRDDIVITPNVAREISPISLNMSNCSDLVPVVAVLASFASGVSELTGIGFITAKESNRLDDVVAELQKTGAELEVIEDGLRIQPATVRHGNVLGTHHDHRLAMSMALLGLRIPSIEIEDPHVVTKSWPSYWTSMKPFFSSRPPRRSTVAFDVDKTLTTRDCVVPFFIRSIGLTAFVRHCVRHLLPVTRFVMRRDRDGLKEFAVKLVFAGRSVQEIEQIGEDFASHVTQHWMRKDTCAMLKWHQENGDDIVFVTASLEPYMQPMAKAMGVATVICSAMENDGDTYSGGLVGGNCRGDEKARRLTNWLQGRLLDYAYGDSAGDDEMLAMACMPIRVGRRDISPSQLIQ